MVAFDKLILVVDDEQDIVELVSLVLEEPGLSVLSAYNGQQALDILQEQHPDLILSDVMMPHLDGLQLCKRIKSTPSTRDTIIILMTAAGGLSLDDCGADALIRKPFDITAVQDTVRRYLAERS